jgi:hypothetical protein
MLTNNSDNEAKLDEQIAQFADQVIESNEAIEMNHTDQEAEFAKLQKTIIALKAAVKSAQPDENARMRIRKNVLITARKEKINENNKPISRKFPNLAVAGGLAFIVLLGLLLTPFPEMKTSLSGSAQETSGWLPFVIITGAVLIALIVWLKRQK